MKSTKWDETNRLKDMSLAMDGFHHKLHKRLNFHGLDDTCECSKMQKEIARCLLVLSLGHLVDLLS